MKTRVMAWTFALIFLLLPLQTALATGTLWFAADGYDLEFEVGHVDKAVIGSLQLHTPATRGHGGILLGDGLKIIEFDTEGRRITLSYDGSDKGAPPFRFEARGATAVLHIDGKARRAPFNWMM